MIAFSISHPMFLANKWNLIYNSAICRAIFCYGRVGW